MLRKPRRSSHLVVALIYDGLATFEFGCTVELFALDRAELGVQWYDFAVCSADGAAVRAAGGIEIRARHSLALLDRADTIVIPGWRNVEEAPPAALLRKLRAAHQRGARLCTICSGSFLLAAAGLLDGKTATTHWRHAARFARRYPAVSVQPDALYIDHGQILTSAGSAAGLDMLLHLVRRDYGARVANQVAQRLVIPPHREGGQAQYIPRPMPSDERHRLSKLLDWVRAHPAAEHTLKSLARRASMSPRTLQRQFRQTVGLAPNEWLVRERVALAQDILQSSQRSLPQVAQAVGFKSQESFRRHFRRVAGVSPMSYRRQFGRVARYSKT